MSLEKINMEVSIERSKDHACAGFVLYCKDTERSIASFWNESDAENAEIAINSYDANQALIAKQAEQIKVLREALEMFRPEIYYNQNGEEIYVGGKFTIYSDGDADSEAMQHVHEVLEATKEQA